MRLRQVRYFLPRYAPAVLALLLPLMLGACGLNPEKLLAQINAGDTASAINKLDAALAGADPSLPETKVLQLLAAHARLQHCAAQGCVSNAVSASVPSLLQPVGQLLAAVPKAVALGKDLPLLTSSSIVTSATLAFAQLPNQPAAMLVLRITLPTDREEAGLANLFLPALQKARAGNQLAAATQLKALDAAASLPRPLRYQAGWLAGQLAGDTDLAASRATALRALAQADLPPASLALLPHAALVTAGNSPAALQAMSVMFTNPTGLFATPAAKAVVAAELATLAATPALQAPWAATWRKTQGPLGLALQRTSLYLNPNQPAVWQAYLPALVAAVQQGAPVAELSQIGVTSFAASSLSGPSRTQLGTALLAAAAQLKASPGAAAPLLLLASQLQLETPQQTALDKLAQELLIKAASAKDVTATLALAQARPAAALNNRQQVVPLLVEEIRASLRTGQFARAISTTTLITTGLGLELELAPLVLEEFNAEQARRKTPAALAATSPTWLLQPPAVATLELGPIWGFMADYFADRPDVLRGQLTTLIANAGGNWGPPSAMYRLLAHFPPADQPAQQQWLLNAMLAAAQEDQTLDAASLVALSGKLAATHEGLPLVPLLETALLRTNGISESRALWQAAPVHVRGVLRRVRPQLASLMRGLEATTSGDTDGAATAFGQLTEGTWLTQAEAPLQDIYGQLANIAGLYVPISAAPEVPLAAIWLAPQGLSGGALNGVSITLLNRLGTLASTNPATLVTTPATLNRLTLNAPYSFNQRHITLTPAVLAASNGGSMAQVFGDIISLHLSPQKSGTLLAAKLRNGSTLRLNRVLQDPLGLLNPDGQYSLTTPLAQSITPAISGGEGILPPGSILTLQTAPSTQPASFDYGFMGDVYPLLGTLQHPGASRPISFTGEYDAATLTSAFTFSYPLPGSGQQVRAEVKCQTLAGPLTCGAHHRHSPRIAYAALTRGLQTQESLQATATKRAALNTAAAALLLNTANQALSAKIAAAPSAQPQRSQATGGLLTAVSGTSAAASATTPTVTSGTTPSQPRPRPPAIRLQMPVAQTPEAVTASAVSLTAGIAATSPTGGSTLPPAGVFIHRGDDGKVTLGTDTQNTPDATDAPNTPNTPNKPNKLDSPAPNATSPTSPTSPANPTAP